MGETRHTLWARRAHKRVRLLYIDDLIFYLEAPRSGPRRAPGGPPEDQCKTKQEMVWSTTFDDSFRAM